MKLNACVAQLVVRQTLDPKVMGLNIYLQKKARLLKAECLNCYVGRATV